MERCIKATPFRRTLAESSSQALEPHLSKHKVVIQIANPLPGGSNYTNPRRAHHFIATGRAVAVGPFAIRFVSRAELERQIAAEIKLRYAGMTINWKDPQAGGLATTDQAQGIPMAGPAQKIFREGPARFKARALSRGPVRHVFSATV